MKLPPPAALEAALEATWPPARVWEAGGFRLRDGAGGGRRASAATAACPAAAAGAGVEAAIAASPLPLFRLRPGEEALDAALAARGFARGDATLFLAAPVTALAEAPPPLTVLPSEAPLARMAELWAEGGTGPERLAVMARAAGPRSFLLAREEDRAAGVAFVALGPGGIAMLHALYVTPRFRRRGIAARMVRAAAEWAGARGGRTLALLTLEANAPARALFARLGLAEAGRCWYRAAPTGAAPGAARAG